MINHTEKELLLIEEINQLESTIEGFELDNLELESKNKAMKAAITNIVNVVYAANNGLLENWFDKIHNAAIDCEKSLGGNDE